MSFLQVVKKYLWFCWKSKGLYSLFLVTGILAGVLMQIHPFFFKWIIDAINTGEYLMALHTLGFFAVTMIVGYSMDVLNFYFTAKMIAKLYISTNSEYISSLRDMDYSYHANKSSGSLISLAKRGDGAIWTMIFSVNKRSFHVLVGFIFAVCSVSYYDVKTGLLLGALLIVNFVLMYFLIKRNIEARKLMNKEDDTISGLIVDNLIAFENVKFFGKSLYEKLRFAKAMIPWEKSQQGYMKTFLNIDITLAVSTIIGMIGILYLSILGVQDGTLGIGTFALIATFLISVFNGLFEMTYELRNLAKSYADLKRYFETMELESQVKDPEHPKKVESIEGNVDFKKLSFAFPDGKEVLKNINIQLPKGKTLALVGRSGGGKTTLTRLLMRLYDIKKGSITIDDVNIKDLKQVDLRKNIGLVPQDPVLFNESIGFNIGYPKEKTSQKEIEHAAKLANLHEFIMSLPKKYETVVGERGIKLSGGQKQRLAIARVFLYNPKIIIFDEATSQLDSENEKQIQDAFKKLSKDRTTIIIAHRLSTISHADQIVVLDEGHIIEQGSHKDLLNKKGGLYKKLWQMQTDGMIE